MAYKNPAYKKEWHAKNRDKIRSRKMVLYKTGVCMCGKSIWNTAKACKSCRKIGNHYAKGWEKGKRHSDQTKEKISISIKNLFQDNKNHPRWKQNREDLVRSEKKHLDGRYREWMLSVKNRDGWGCRISNGSCSGRLEAHHILDWKNYPELRYETNNGITLCHAHHPRGRAEEKRLTPYFMGLVSVSKE